MAHNITTAKGRHALTARPSVYYGPKLDAGLYLGIRRLPDGGSWVARYRPANGESVYRTLGPVAGLSADDGAIEHVDAAELARAWLVELKTGRPARSGKITLAEVVAAYIEDLDAAEIGERKGKRHHAGTNAATDARHKMQRNLVGHPIGHLVRGRPIKTPASPHPIARRPVDEITKLEFKQWRKGLRRFDGVTPLAIGSVDKILGTLIAALNFGLRERMIAPGREREWREGLQKSGIVARRELYLDHAQRRAFVAAAYKHSAELGVLVEAIAVTGMRVGEASALTVDRFDERAGVLNIKSSKTGPRTVPLTGEAIALFKRCAKSKTPLAPLLANESGGHWHSNDLKHLSSIVARAGLPAGTILYTLRHSWITQALSGQTVRGEFVRFSTLFVSRSCGTSLKMIEKHYGHIAEDEVKRMRDFAFA